MKNSPRAPKLCRQIPSKVGRIYVHYTMKVIKSSIYWDRHEFGNLAINIYAYQQGSLAYSAFNYRFVGLGIFNFLKLLAFAFYLPFRSVKIFISDQSSWDSYFKIKSKNLKGIKLETDREIIVSIQHHHQGLKRRHRLKGKVHNNKVTRTLFPASWLSLSCPSKFLASLCSLPIYCRFHVEKTSESKIHGFVCEPRPHAQCFGSMWLTVIIPSLYIIQCNKNRDKSGKILLTTNRSTKSYFTYFRQRNGIKALKVLKYVIKFNRLNYDETQQSMK